ncbi:MAG: PASTA domain-containing protein, partial [Thermoleophilia bacterium]|nr:PASTA domain-containing protein [Thermoleophilia bacterium]
MSDFVEERRRERKRLRVPDPVANEMAADLAADLEEAEAEGVSAEEVLGSGAFDPRAFAVAWATERGVARPRWRDRVRTRRLLSAAVVLLIILAVTLLAIAGLAIALVASTSGSTATSGTGPAVPVPTRTETAALVEAPNLIGLRQAAVQGAVVAGLVVEIAHRRRAGAVGKGTVVAQSRPPGSAVPP